MAVRFEVDAFRATLDLKQNPIPPSDRIPGLYLDHLIAHLPAIFLVDVDGSAVTFRVVGRTVSVTDHIRVELALEADWPTPILGQHQFALLDDGWNQDEASKIALSLDASPGILLLEAEVPEGDRNRRLLRARFASGRIEPPGRYRPSLPPEPEPDKPSLGEGVGRPGGAVAIEMRTEPGQGWSKSDNPALPEEAPAKPKPRTLRSLLLDSNVGLGMLLVLAGLFGAAHALTPGHGKTMVAAYLIGERGTMGHAVLLGIVTTLTHTSSVLILAAILPFLVGREAHLQSALEFVGGLLIALMGAFLLLRRLGGGGDHVHGPGGHTHGPVGEGTTVRWIDLIVLGIAGGIVPCWDAIAMLALAIASGQFWLGLPLLLAFSAGLAFVLVAIGIAVVATRDLTRPYVESHRGLLETVGRLLPIATAVLITVIGMWLCYDALHVGNHND